MFLRLHRNTYMPTHAFKCIFHRCAKICATSSEGKKQLPPTLTHIHVHSHKDTHTKTHTQGHRHTLTHTNTPSHIRAHAHNHPSKYLPINGFEYASIDAYFSFWTLSVSSPQPLLSCLPCCVLTTTVAPRPFGLPHSSPLSCSLLQCVCVRECVCFK